MKNYSLSGKKDVVNVLLAPNAFKGTLEAPEFCRILTEELSSPSCHVVSLPQCDGGDGTAAIVASYLRAQPVSTESYDALGRLHAVTYYRYEDTALLDLASICGIKDLSPEEYDVYNCNTAGLGKVLFRLSQQNIRKIILGVGGSASIDGGLGALVEMGLDITKSNNRYRNHLIEIDGLTPGRLKENFKNTEFILLCDVDNRLCGPAGATFTFGPQKGATPLQMSQLEERMHRYSDLLLSTTGEEVLSLPYGGAAGGIAAAFHALLGAKLISGADYCLEVSGFQEKLIDADLVITGEGKLDEQSCRGKLPGVISTFCRKARIPVIGIAGRIQPPLPDFDQVYVLIDYAENLLASLRQPGYYLRKLAKDLKKNMLNLL